MSTKVTVIAVNGDPVVHKSGCAHLGRLESERSSDVKYDIDVETAQEVANDFWSDMIDEGSMDESEALAQTQFGPCLRNLK